jgi:predicted aldo/keto reductase-like oxidoreductase
MVTKKRNSGTVNKRNIGENQTDTEVYMENEVIQSRKCYETALKYKKPIVVMEPIKGGTLVNLRPEVEKIFKAANPNASLASWAIRYSASLEGIITVLSGMSNMEQILDNASFMGNFQSLNEHETTVIKTVSASLQDVETIGCTGCRYCVDDCPQKINIPKVMELLNDYRVYKDIMYSKRRYENGMAASGKASGCIGCLSCESHCPQKLNITAYLKEAAGLFE